VPTRVRNAGDHLLALWHLARPAIWLVSIVPFMLGFMLASGRILPRAGGAGDFGLAVFVIGPLVWAAALLINDAADLEGDRGNPRRARSPMVRGRVSVRFAVIAAHAAAALAIVLGLLVNGSFAILVAAFLAVAWAYSVPPVRLKTRPGADVAANAIGIGAIVVLAGWSVAAPVGAFPFWFLGQSMLVTTALYVPSALVDLEADVAVGYRTIATALGRARAFAIGRACWVACNLAALGLAATGQVLPRAMLPVLVVAVPVLIVAYERLIGRATSPRAMVRGLIVLSFLFLASNVAFVVLSVR